MASVFVEGSEEIKSILQVLRHDKLKPLLGLTPPQLETWINTNVLDLDDAKEVLIALGVAVVVLVKNIRDEKGI